MNNKEKEYNNNPISVWMNLVFIVPMFILFYLLYMILRDFSNQYDKLIEKSYIISFFILFIIFISYTIINIVFTKNKNIKKYCYSITLILFVYLGIVLFLLYSLYSIINALDFNSVIGAVDYLSVANVNARFEEYDGTRERGSTVMMLKREVESLERNNIHISLIGADNIVSTKRYNIVVSKVKGNSIEHIIIENDN